jgi:hypothetical protein
MVEIRQKGSGPQATPAHRHYDREPGNGVAEAMPAHRASVRHGRRRPASRSSLRPPASPARGLGDPVHRAHHDRGLQARRPAGSRPASAGVPGTGSGGDRADRQHPGQAGIHPGELRRVQALAQVADQWAADRPGSGPAGQQDDRSAPVGHGPAPGPGSPGGSLVRRRSPSPACPPPAKSRRAGRGRPSHLFNAHDSPVHPACHRESVREAQCQPETSAATVK